MRALRYHGKHDIRCDTVADPIIEQTGDVWVSELQQHLRFPDEARQRFGLIEGAGQHELHRHVAT